MGLTNPRACQSLEFWSRAAEHPQPDSFPRAAETSLSLPALWITSCKMKLGIKLVPRFFFIMQRSRLDSYQFTGLYAASLPLAGELSRRSTRDWAFHPELHWRTRAQGADQQDGPVAGCIFRTNRVIPSRRPHFSFQAFAESNLTVCRPSRAQH